MIHILSLAILLIVLCIYFMDFALWYGVCQFNIFMSLPCYAYAFMGYSYMMNWYVISLCDHPFVCCSVNVILKDQPNDKQGNLNRLRLRILVYASIIILLTSFVTLYVISISEECTDYLTKSR